MLNYKDLKEKPREFLAATGMTQEEFQILLPNFETAYESLYRTSLTFADQERKRSVGAGVPGKLSKFEDQLLFVLVYQKTNPFKYKLCTGYNLA